MMFTRGFKRHSLENAYIDIGIFFENYLQGVEIDYGVRIDPDNNHYGVYIEKYDLADPTISPKKTETKLLGPIEREELIDELSRLRLPDYLIKDESINMIDGYKYNLFLKVNRRKAIYEIDPTYKNADALKRFCDKIIYIVTH